MGFNNQAPKPLRRSSSNGARSAAGRTSGRHQPRQIKNHATGESRRRLRRIFSHASSHADFLSSRQFAQHAELAATADKAALDEIFAALQEINRQSASASGNQQSPFW